MILADAHLDYLKHPTVVQLESLNFTTFHIVALVIFGCSIIHTLCVYKVNAWAKAAELCQGPRSKKQGLTFGVQLLYFLSEVEIVFALWAIPLFIAMMGWYGWTVALEYINTRNFTEPLFVVVILAMASTRPIIRTAEKVILLCAKAFGGTLSAWWFVLLTIGPLLGSFITEAAAMALCAYLLSRQFYAYRPSKMLAYATLGLLFVNVSVGGILTDFASPAVLLLAHSWSWSISDMFFDFGWKAVMGIALANSVYWLYFRKELRQLDIQRRKMRVQEPSRKEPPIPAWITLIHVLVMGWIVAVSHYPAICIASFLFFVGFHQATKMHQDPIRLARPLLIGLFLAGLLIHGGLQGWWVVSLMDGLSPLSVMGVAIALTGFNDNAGISYLSTLVPSWGETFRYAVFTGVIAGGGLTVIANAPNPAGYAILKKHFDKGIKPLNLFLAALIPTIILYAIFFFFGPLF